MNLLSKEKSIFASFATAQVKRGHANNLFSVKIQRYNGEVNILKYLGRKLLFFFIIIRKTVKPFDLRGSKPRKKPYSLSSKNALCNFNVLTHLQITILNAKESMLCT